MPISKGLTKAKDDKSFIQFFRRGGHKRKVRSIHILVTSATSRVRRLAISKRKVMTFQRPDRAVCKDRASSAIVTMRGTQPSLSSSTNSRLNQQRQSSQQSRASLSSPPMKASRVRRAQLHSSAILLVRPQVQHVIGVICILLHLLPRLSSLSDPVAFLRENIRQGVFPLATRG